MYRVVDRVVDTVVDRVVDWVVALVALARRRERLVKFLAAAAVMHEGAHAVARVALGARRIETAACHLLLEGHRVHVLKRRYLVGAQHVAKHTHLILQWRRVPVIKIKQI